jgi:hypothetical protein
VSVSGVRRLASFAVALGLVGLAACSERTLAPEATGPSFNFQGGNGGSFHQRNGCGDGHAGSAAATLVAVYGRNGSTEITVTSYSAKDTLFATPAGCITTLDLTAYAPNADDGGHGYDRGHRDFWFSGRDHGSQRWSRHFDRLNTGSSFTVTVTGLQPGMRIQAEAIVGCLSRGRTDDVTAQSNVIRRTDPAVTALTVPASAYVNLPVLLIAQIKELNGQQGASGTCYLSVGTVLTDSVPNLAVAAGDSVACQFAPTFATTGTRQLTVTYGHVTPRDDNPNNNSASASVQIVTAPSGGGGGTTPPSTTLWPFIVNANVYDDTALNYSDVFAMSQRLASNPTVLRDTTNQTTSTVGNVQLATFDGIIYEAVPFPLASLKVSQATGTTTYHSQSWTNVASNGTAGVNSLCANLLSGVVTLVVCSYQPDGTFANGRTEISYIRNDSNVAAVQSAYFVDYTGPTPSACDPTSTDPNQPCYTITTPLGAALPHYQSSYTFSVVLTTPTHVYTSAITIPLASGPLNQSTPYTCDQSTVVGGDSIPVIQRTCLGTTDTRQRKSGVVADLVALTQAK